MATTEELIAMSKRASEMSTADLIKTASRGAAIQEQIAPNEELQEAPKKSLREVFKKVFFDIPQAGTTGMVQEATFGGLGKVAPEFVAGQREKEPGAFAGGQTAGFLAPTGGPGLIFKGAKALGKGIKTATKTGKAGKFILESAGAAGVTGGLRGAVGEEGEVFDLMRGGRDAFTNALFGAVIPGVGAGGKAILTGAGKKILSTAVGALPAITKTAKDFNLANIIKRGLEPTIFSFKSGLKQVDGAITRRLTDLIKKQKIAIGKKAKEPINLKGIMDEVEKESAEQFTVGAGADQALNVLGRFKRQFTGMADEQGIINLARAQKLKTELDKIPSFSADGEATIEKAIALNLANKLRGLIGNIQPKLKPINLEFAELIPIQEAVRHRIATVARGRAITMSDLAFTGIGAGAGGMSQQSAGAAIGSGLLGLGLSRGQQSVRVGTGLQQLGQINVPEVLRAGLIGTQQQVIRNQPTLEEVKQRLINQRLNIGPGASGNF